MTTAVAGEPGARVPRLEVRNLSKRFGPARVLADASLTLWPGEIHALVGQNGSGKSTLIKILAGYHVPERGGEVEVDGEAVSLPIAPGALSEIGISFVHQDLGLVDHLSVAENISVGHETRLRLGRRLDRRAETLEVRRLLDRLSVDLDPAALVRDLAPERRAAVAIARALRTQVPGHGVIILDETTRALSRFAAQAFYRMLHNAVAEGSSVLMVAHSLPEVMAEADRVTVLRDGVVIGSGIPTSKLTEQDIARLMVGQEVGQLADRAATTADAELQMAVRDVDTGVGGRIDFTLSRGEIVGLTGPAGAGWETLPYLLAGAEPARSGTVEVAGRVVQLPGAKVRTLLRTGIVLVPERRDLHGVAQGLSVLENISLPRMRTRGRAYFSGLFWQREEAERVIRQLGVHPPDPDRAVGTLSGGNQQKVLFGKWLLHSPKVLIAHEPTQGVDIAARQDLLNALRTAAESGTSVLLVSNDPNDLSAICTRVLIVRQGTVAEELSTPSADDIVESVYEGSLEARKS